MAENVKAMARQVLNELPEDDLVDVLSFVDYLRWRREETDQSWFWTQEWQARYQEAKADLAEGRFREFDDVEALLAELKSQPDASE